MSEGELSYKQKSAANHDLMARRKWNARFASLGIELPPGRIPSNKYGTQLRVPTSAISIIIKRCVARGWMIRDIASATGLGERRIALIRDCSNLYTRLETADSILTGMDMNDLWHTELKEVYNFAFRGCISPS